MQRGTIILPTGLVTVELPDPNEPVLKGISWGSIDAFPSPAYWAYQVISRRIEGTSINYRIGNNLVEEVGACLLGGHGIPADIGIAAFHHIKSRGGFGEVIPRQEQLLTWLSEPLCTPKGMSRYRFSKQKSTYLHAALCKLHGESPPTESGQELRKWLLEIPGIGLKTASWVARNWLDADDVSILDIHILRAGVLAGFFSPDLTVERDYLKLECQFVEFSRALGVRPSELDSVIWLEMKLSPKTIRSIFQSQQTPVAAKKKSVVKRRADQCHADANQSALLI